MANVLWVRVTLLHEFGLPFAPLGRGLLRLLCGPPSLRHDDEQFVHARELCFALAGPMISARLHHVLHVSGRR
jgi:hypothetical protein